MVLVRVIEIVVGLTFVLAAIFKAVDLHSFAVQIRYYGVLPSFGVIRYAALVSIAAETLIGAALMAGIRFRGWTHILADAMLVVFSVLVLYAWIYNDLKDCGCFGAVLPLGPPETLGKNAILFAALTFAWYSAAKKNLLRDLKTSPYQEAIQSGTVLICILFVVAVMALADNHAFFSATKVNPERPFQGLWVQMPDGTDVSLEEGEFLIAMLSATCEDCAAAVEPLNEFARTYESPRIVGLILGDETQIDHFITMTKPDFPVKRLEADRFFRMISNTAPPPRFYIARDGIPLRDWDTLHVTFEELTDFAFNDAPRSLREKD